MNNLKTNIIEIITYPIIPYLSPGSRLQPDQRNNHTNWLRVAINVMMNRHKADLVKAGVNIDLFHNHDTTRLQNMSEYPRIQYQRRGNRYYVTGINEGKYALEKLFEDCRQMVYIHDTLALRIGQAVTETFVPRLAAETFSYRLTDWLPFSDDSEKEFKTLPSLAGKMLYLEKRLRSHITGDFCRYLIPEVDTTPVQLAITDIDSLNRAAVMVEENKHTQAYKPFTAEIRINFPLPANICLGNKKVYGFGLVEPAQ